MIFYTKTKPKKKKIAIISPNGNVVCRRMESGIISTLQKVDDLRVTYTTLQCEDDFEALHRRAEHLIARNRFDLLYTIGRISTRIAKQLTELYRTYTPIVFGAVIDPVEAGFVRNAEYSGNHLTGISSIARNYNEQYDDLQEILQYARTEINKIIFVYAPETTAENLKDIAVSLERMRRSGRDVVELKVKGIKDTLKRLSQHTTQGSLVFVPRDGFVTSHIKEISKICCLKKIPLVASDLDSARIGGAIGFGDLEQNVGIKCAHHSLPIFLEHASASALPLKTLQWNKKILINKPLARIQNLKFDYNARIFAENSSLLSSEECSNKIIVPY